LGKAEEFYTKGKAFKHARCAYSLGCLYLQRSELERAAENFQLAGELGQSRAYFQLALIAEQEKDTEKY
jgi:hypothetical protein